MSALATKLPRLQQPRRGFTGLAVLGVLLIGVMSGRVAISHYGKLVIEAVLVLAAAGLLTGIVARRPALAIGSVVAALIFVPVTRAPVVQHLTLHPALVLCLFVAVALFLLTDADTQLPLSGVDVAVLILVASMLVAICVGPRTWKDAAGQLWLWIPPYVAGRAIAARHPLSRMLANAIVIGGVALAPFAFAEALGLGSPFFGAADPTNPSLSPWDQPHLRAGEGFRVQASFGHPIAYSMFLATAIIFALVLFGNATDRRRRRLYAAATAILLACEVLTVSRTGFVMLAVVMAILAAGRATHASSRMARRAIGAGVTVLVAVALFVPSVAAVPLSIVGLQSDTNDPTLQLSAAYRGGLYSAAFSHGVASWFGNQTSKLANTVEVDNSSVDSAYLNLLDNWGIIVAVAFLLVAGTVAARALTTATTSDDEWTKTFSATATGLAVGLGSVALITQQEYLVWLLFGLAAVPRTAPAVEGVAAPGGSWRFRPSVGARPRTWKTNREVVAASLRRYWWIPVLCAAAVAAAVLVVPRLSGPRYSTSAALLFQTPQFDQMVLGTAIAGHGSASRAAGTDLALLDLTAVADQTASAIGPSVSPQRVARDVQLTETGRSDVFVLQATDADPRMAARIANTYAQQYKLGAIRRAQASIEARIAIDRAELGAMTPAQALGSTASGLRTSIQNLVLLASLQNGGVEVIQRARVPGAQSSPVNKRGILYAAFLGLLLGLLLVTYLGRRDRRLWDLRALEDAFDAPALGSVPKLSARPASARHWRSLGGRNAFALLRGTLRYFNVDRPLRCLLVTSPARCDGRTLIAAELARAEADAGHARILLLEADLRNPQMASTLGVSPRPGLTDVLSRTTSLAQAIAEVPVFDRGQPEAEPAMISVLPAGTRAANPAALLESRAMSELLETLSRQFDLVIIDAPPLSVVADAVPLIKSVDGVIVVARPGTTRRNQAHALRDQLSGLSAPVLGVVANLVPSGRRRPFAAAASRS